MTAFCNLILWIRLIYARLEPSNIEERVLSELGVHDMQAPWQKI
jgi:hypothetical protein